MTQNIYLGPFELGGSVARGDLEVLYDAPNTGDGLGALVVNHMGVISPFEVRRELELTLPQVGLKGLFIAQKIRRELTQCNTVANVNDGVATWERSDRISAVGSLEGEAREYLLAHLPQQADFSSVALQVLRSHTGENTLGVRVQLPLWQSSEAKDS